VPRVVVADFTAEGLAKLLAIGQPTVARSRRSRPSFRWAWHDEGNRDAHSRHVVQAVG